MTFLNYKGIENKSALTAKRANPHAGTFKLEKEIDQLVAPRQLYGLSEGEIKIVAKRKT